LFEYDQAAQLWHQLQTSSKSSLNAVISLDAQTSMVVGNNGAMVTISPQTSTFKQSADGKAIVGGLMHDGQLLAVTGVGIKHFQREP
jgi:hypothetical protein